MNRKITLTIPDDLAEKIDLLDLDRKMDLAEVFQKAVRKVIQDAAKEEYLNRGRKEGLEWARVASERDLLDGVDWQGNFYRFEVNPSKKGLFVPISEDGDRWTSVDTYMQNRINADPMLKPKNPTGHLNEEAEAWVKGFFEGIREYTRDHKEDN